MTRARAPGECCTHWAELSEKRRAKWGWQVLHQWAHSRVPFTVGRLAEIGDVTPERAVKAVEIACQRKWIWRADPGVGGGVEQYVGRLTPRRR